MAEGRMETRMGQAAKRSERSVDAAPDWRSAVCPHDCADRCRLRACVAEGRLIALAGDPDHPVTQGFICRKIAELPARLNGPERLRRPLLRGGPKGSGEFRPIGWAEAIATIAQRWQAILATDGPYAILPFFGSGTEGLVQGHIAPKRFFNRLGSLQMIRTICTRAGRTGYRQTMGGSISPDPTAIGGCSLVVLWGVNPAATNIHQLPTLKEARARGAKLVVVNPVRIRGAEGADLVLQPKPGSDAALALGVMHALVRDGRHDADFVARATMGFEELARRLADYPPQRVAGLTGLTVAEIEAFARLYGEHRHSFISVGPGCQRHSNGGLTLRSIACLPGLTGALRFAGGGVYFPTSTIFPHDWHELEGEELRPTPAAGYNMIHLAHMLNGTGFPIRSLFVAQGNPASVLYNQSALRAGLGREDLFTVVHDLFLTDTARLADIVLPATSAFEQADLFFSYFVPALYRSQRIVAPPGEARSNRQLFGDLAQALGFGEACFAQDDDALIRELLAADHPAIRGLDRARLDAQGWAPVAAETTDRRFGPDRALPEDLRLRFADATLAAPEYLPPKESEEGSPDRFARYPLALVTPSGHSFLNSNYAGEAGLTAEEIRPTLYLHPDDAARRGVANGDRVTVFNDRGRFEVWAVVEARVKPGVAVAPGQWWSRHYPCGGNANMTTPDFVADLGGGSAFNSNLVEVRRADGI